MAVGGKQEYKRNIGKTTTKANILKYEIIIIIIIIITTCIVYCFGIEFNLIITVQNTEGQSHIVSSVKIAETQQ